MQIDLNLFPNGRTKALTMSYDDGVTDDIRLIDILNRHSIKGTFHLNAGLFGKADWSRLAESEIKATYAGHEISAHGYTHQALASIPDTGVIAEIMQDREKLEELTGGPIRGMSYAFGSVDERVLAMLPMLGIEYGRVVETTGGFGLPADFLRWQGTCHHNDRLLERGDEFLSQGWHPLMYVWGHSYEFSGDNNWDLIEAFCAKMGGHEDIWYATNIEICDYVKALRGLKFTARQDAVYNPAALDLWIRVNGEAQEVKGGETIAFSAGDSA